MGYRHKIKRLPNPPFKRSGHLYYLRMNTNQGVMYKIGFTTLASPQERLAYQGKGHEKLIDAVLCFVHLEDAWDVEQELHQLFAKKALFYGGHEMMPLFGNGQSELYREDVLNMDPAFKADQSEKTRVNILATDFRSFGATEEKVQELIKNEEDRYRKSRGGRGTEVAPSGPQTMTMKALALLLRPALWLFFGFFNQLFKLLLPNEEKSKKRISELMETIKAADVQSRSNRQVEIRRLEEKVGGVIALQGKELYSYSACSISALYITALTNGFARMTLTLEEVQEIFNDCFTGVYHRHLKSLWQEMLDSPHFDDDLRGMSEIVRQEILANRFEFFYKLRVKYLDDYEGSVDIRELAAADRQWFLKL